MISASADFKKKAFAFDRHSQSAFAVIRGAIAVMMLAVAAQAADESGSNDSDNVLLQREWLLQAGGQPDREGILREITRACRFAATRVCWPIPST